MTENSAVCCIRRVVQFSQFNLEINIRRYLDTIDSNRELKSILNNLAGIAIGIRSHHTRINNKATIQRK